MGSVILHYGSPADLKRKTATADRSWNRNAGGCLNLIYRYLVIKFVWENRDPRDGFLQIRSDKRAPDASPSPNPCCVSSNLSDEQGRLGISGKVRLEDGSSCIASKSYGVSSIVVPVSADKSLRTSHPESDEIVILHLILLYF